MCRLGGLYSDRRPLAAFSSPRSQFLSISLPEPIRLQDLLNPPAHEPRKKNVIHQIFSLARDWSKRVTWANIPQLKLGEYPRIFPNFQNCAHCVKDLKDNKDNSLHLGRKYAWIFVLRHYLFLVAHSFPRVTLSQNCSLLGTDNVRGQIS